ncbi:TAXI family TRAP transporter solute-binding subunit [Martelella mediterranea]|uniref:TRAP transporter solute receptor, TAXI family n=1 Tax=Martelella mediterranea DSM 17316 TaxID=1122214 RepID=A0A1U9YVU5_9HYPH|nr:TAXI family TRAP transporter solute-binding subunit [Martelella mediterranea]AQZ49510.1 TRAP transporter solute receptor, TAXI family [Martelella mediterranea DSM 17316]
MKFRTFAAGVLLAACSFGSAALAQDLRFGSGQQGSQNYGVNAALAQAIGTNTDMDVTVQSFGGATAFVPLINAGELDIAALVTPDAGDAIRGNGPFKGMAQDNIALVAALLPSPVGLMVRADSGIETIADLKGKRMAWGVPAQASLLPYFEGALANGGLTPDDVTTVPVSSVRTGVEALVNGDVDATLFALRAGAVVEADSALGGIAWLPFDDSPEAVERMNAVAPEAYIYDVAADAGVVGAPDAFKTMAYDYVLVARKDLDPAVVSEIAEMINTDPAALAASNPILGAMSQESVSRVYTKLPYHEGAQLSDTE